MNYPPEITEFLFYSRSRHYNARKKLFASIERDLRRPSHYYLLWFRPKNMFQTASLGNKPYKLIVIEGAPGRSKFFDERKSKARTACLEYGESPALERNRK